MDTTKLEAMLKPVNVMTRIEELIQLTEKRLNETVQAMDKCDNAMALNLKMLEAEQATKLSKVLGILYSFDDEHWANQMETTAEKHLDVIMHIIG